MDIMTRLASLSPRDALAIGFMVISWLVIGWLSEHPPRRRPSTALLMEEYRRDWMRQFVTRQPRIFDANVIDNLRQGTAFLASACMIALGGGVALIGNSDRVAGLAADLQLNTGALMVELKVIFVLLLVANALLKFIWANRLFGYCAILMAAVPNDPEDPTAYHRASQAAEVNITAARGFNRGLRSVYFAIAALGWLVGPEALVATTLMTLAITARREFWSTSRAVIANRMED